MMQKLTIDRETYLIESYAETGDVLSVKKPRLISTDNLYLLTGESLQITAYYPFIQVLAVLKKRGFDFVLCMFLPLRLTDAILKYVEQAGISDHVYLIEDEREMSDMPYKERICVPIGLNHCLLLGSGRIMIEADFYSIMENCFGERADEYR